jgi:uncharacterized protein YidB (DUF937 family)
LSRNQNEITLSAANNDSQKEVVMGLLDQLLNKVLGSNAGPQQNQLLDMAINFVQSYPGGLPGLIQKFTSAGYGQQVNSWVGTGQNMQISAEDLSRVLGHGNVQSMEQKAGLPAQSASGGLAALLPVLIDQLTPKGQVDDRTDLASALNSMRGRLG